VANFGREEEGIIVVILTVIIGSHCIFGEVVPKVVLVSVHFHFLECSPVYKLLPLLSFDLLLGCLAFLWVKDWKKKIKKVKIKHLFR
jgi:hypothetical protein